MTNSPSAISLTSLCQHIKETISETYWESTWVIAEISDIKINRNGHCYLELIEKDDSSDQITARIKAVIWAYTFKFLKPYFETTTGQTLTAGLKILIKCNVEFQEIYGLSLNIKDLDPTFTLGDLAQRRQQIINQLKDEGVFEMNKELILPNVLQKIAVISSPTAAGYEDFMKQLNNNPFRYAFSCKLFEAVMQGERAEESIISALDTIYSSNKNYDVIVLIRGGGSSTDLLCFDAYNLAVNIAQFPIPVITGIGHERDTSIADMVANIQLKTPTAVAEFIIDQNREFEIQIEEYKERAIFILEDRLVKENEKLKYLFSSFTPKLIKHLSQQHSTIGIISNVLANKSNNKVIKEKQLIYQKRQLLKLSTKQQIKNDLKRLDVYKENITKESHQLIKYQKQTINLFEHQNLLNDPLSILQKGYSITYKNGNVVKNQSDLKSGDEIITQLKQGRTKSIVR